MTTLASELGGEQSANRSFAYSIDVFLRSRPKRFSLV